MENKNVINIDEIELENSLGVTLIDGAEPIYFGNIHKKEKHENEWKNKVEKTEAFENLKLNFDDDTAFSVKITKAAALKGVLTICNLSSDASNDSFMILSPKNLSSDLACVMKEICDKFLNKLSNIFVAVVDENGEHDYCDINGYRKLCEETLEHKVLEDDNQISIKK